MARTTTEKKIHLARTWASGHPVWCAWQVNYRCNFRCLFCHYWADPMGDQPELSVADFRAGARKLAPLGTLLISLAGGEPLIRPDIVDIVAGLAEWHMPFLTINGWFSTPVLARELLAAGLWGVSVSIDYADAARHDHRRGMPGAFERALAALEHFAAARRHPWQRVNWMCVLMDDNLDQVEPMIRMAAERDAYFMLQPYGVRKTGATRFVHKSSGQQSAVSSQPVGQVVLDLPAGRVRPALHADSSVARHLLGLRRRYRNFLSNPYYLSRFDEALNGGVAGCRAGRGFFSIDSTGDIAVCVEERARPVANLYAHSAGEILRRLRADQTPQGCRACWYNCRGEIESLYDPLGVVPSFFTMLLDRGRPPGKPRAVSG